MPLCPQSFLTFCNFSDGSVYISQSPSDVAFKKQLSSPRRFCRGDFMDGISSHIRHRTYRIATTNIPKHLYKFAVKKTLCGTIILLSAPINSHLQCAAQKILLFIANEPISQATNLFCQLQSLIPLSFEHRFAKPFRLRRAGKQIRFP